MMPSTKLQQAFLFTSFFTCMAGCATSPTMIMLMPDRAGHVGSASVATGKSLAVLSAAGDAVTGADGEVTNRKDLAATKRAFKSALFAVPEEAMVFAVYFEFGNDTILPESRAVVEQAASLIAAHGSKQVQIYGYADRVGEATFNRDLSVKRANSIEKALIKAGIMESCLFATGFGEMGPPPVTTDGFPDLRSRRVDIVVH